MICLIGSLCYLEITEESEDCEEMFHEVDDGEWDISDDDDDDLRGDSEKKNTREMKRFQLSWLLCFADFCPVLNVTVYKGLLERACIPINISIIACLEIPFSNKCII